MEVGARRGRPRAAVLPFPHPSSLCRLGPRELLPRVWVPREAELTPGQQLNGDDVSAAIQAIADARRAGFADRVFTVRSSSDELTFVLANHFELRFGDASDLAAKVMVARRIVPLAADFGYVDISVPDRPVAGGRPQLS